MNRVDKFNRPGHIAIIMDGNGRWARKRHLPRAAGHRSGVKTLRRVVEHCITRGIGILTVYAFSSENWQRPEDEVNSLMDLFLSSIKDQVQDLHDNNVRLRFIGEVGAFSLKLQQSISSAEELTLHNTGLQLVVAVNYGGRWDIMSACRRVAEKVRNLEISVDQIDERLLAGIVSLADVRDPDLFIRTGGEKRISNFLLWQMAYTELYFTDVLWPDFGTAELDVAIEWFSERQRRFGRTSEQIDQARSA